MTNYENKYLKYKNKYHELKNKQKGGASGPVNVTTSLDAEGYQMIPKEGEEEKDADEFELVPEVVNILLYISTKNVGSGKHERKEVEEEKKQLMQGIFQQIRPLEIYYTDHGMKENDYTAGENIKIITLTNNNLDELKANLTLIREKYNYANLTILLSGHGSNLDIGFLNYYTEDLKHISLIEILNLLDNELLDNITLYLGPCRSVSSTKSDQKQKESIQKLFSGKKNIAIITGSWRGSYAYRVTLLDTKHLEYAGIGALSGSQLILSYIRCIAHIRKIWQDSLFNFDNSLELLKNIWIQFNEINKEQFLEHNRLSQTDMTLSDYIVHMKKSNFLKYCEKQPSVYLNENAKTILHANPELEATYFHDFEHYLCRNFKDTSAEKSAVSIGQSLMVKDD